MEAPAAIEPPKEPSLLDRLRNMWEFANLAQWIFIFGRAVKIDENFDIEVRILPLSSPSAMLRAYITFLGIGDGMSETSLSSFA